MKYFKYVLILCILSVVFVGYNYYCNLSIVTDEVLEFAGTLNYRPANLFNFSYIIRSQLCLSEKNAHVLVIVTSFAGNIDARNALRQAYPKEELIKLGIIRIFLLAQLRNGQSKVKQQDIVSENNIFSDILQGNFFEAYRNLTYKHMMGLKWASDHCSFMKFVVKMDDDVIVDYYGLINLLSSKGPANSVSLMGYVLDGQSVKRDRLSKWFVTHEEYAPEHYPKFLSGWLYITTPMVAARLVNASSTVPFHWIDDVYVTGLLAREAGISHQDITPLISPFTELLDCCIRDELDCKYIAGPSNGYYALHGMFKSLKDKCSKGSCHYMDPEKRLEDHCTVKWKTPLNGGKAFIQPFSLG